MAELKFGEPFGLELNEVSDVDWKLAVARVIQDNKTDFIYAPHLNYIYRKCEGAVISQIKKELKDGNYLPGVPVTMEVPKSFRIRVASNPPRRGPSFSRPGSILYPKDRILYQLLADKAASIIDAKLDHKRSFSHQLDETNGSAMFKPTRACWNDLQVALAKHANNKKLRYVLKTDVSNYFGSINQHTLINILNDAGYKKKYSSRLEIMLTQFTGDRSSRGIVQGIFPSDMLGNFYLEPIDRFLSDNEIPSARYVDDLYIFVPSVALADRLLRELIPELRRYDLTLNESKSLIIPKTALITEEPDLEKLFDEAVTEIADQIDDEDFDADYGFQSEWDEEDEEDDEETQDEESDEGANLELEATKLLFDSITDYSSHEENIERFCLPLFSKAHSDYALDHVLDAFSERPSMSQIYCSYLSRFIDQPKVYEFLVERSEDENILDWQKMWVLAALFQRSPESDAPVKTALSIAKDAARHDAVRAVAAMYVGRFGDATRRKGLSGLYPNVSPYVQAAIYYTTRSWPSVERQNAKANWGAQSELNKWITLAHTSKVKPTAPTS